MADQATTAPEPISLFTWGTKGQPGYLETPVTDIPVPNLASLALQGYRHKLGNEVAAKGVAWRKTDAGKAASDSEYADYLVQARAEMLDKIVNGVLGVRASIGAPRATGVDAIRRRITVEALRVFLKKHNLAMPTGEATIKVAGTDMSRETLIERMYARDKKAIDDAVDLEIASKQGLGDASLEDFAA